MFIAPSADFRIQRDYRLSSRFWFSDLLRNDAIHHLGRQRRAKAQQRLILIFRFNFQRSVGAFRSLIKPNMFRLCDCMCDVIFRGLTKTNGDCVSLITSRGDTNTLKRQFVSFLLRAHIWSEDFKSRQPTLVLSTENVKEVGPILAR